VWPIWNGALTFGLVTIPVGLYPAAARGDLSFRLLHAKDKSPIAYRRVCAEENVEVPWVVMTEADFEAADVEATQTMDIRDFVVAAEIPPVYFERPYYLEPQKTGAKAYALLREALRRSGAASAWPPLCCGRASTLRPCRRRATR